MKTELYFHTTNFDIFVQDTQIKQYGVSWYMT